MSVEPPSGSATLTFTLLGRLQIVKDGIDHAPSAPKVLQLLGLLLMRPGSVVHNDTIVDELWGDNPPRSVRSTMQTYVYHLRRCVERNGLADDTEALLSTCPPGYVLNVADTQIDVCTFRERCQQGRALLGVGRHREAAQMFRTALDLWSGPPLSNVACGVVLSRYAVELQEQYRNAQHLRVEAEIATGSHRELVGELRSSAAEAALDESIHGQLMRVLAGSGRRVEAMTTFRDLRHRLVDELGVEPCADLQALYVDLLAGSSEPLLEAG